MHERHARYWARIERERKRMATRAAEDHARFKTRIVADAEAYKRGYAIVEGEEQALTECDEVFWEEARASYDVAIRHRWVKGMAQTPRWNAQDCEETPKWETAAIEAYKRGYSDMGLEVGAKVVLRSDADGRVASAHVCNK